MTIVTTLKTSRGLLSRVALAAVLAILPATAVFAQQAAQPGARLTVPITGTTTAAATTASDEPSQTVAGTLTIQRFATQTGVLVAVGTVAATVTNTTTNTASTLVTPVALPISRSTTTGTCEVLHLEVGQTHLALLGLQIDLNQVVLDITAVPGTANPLGSQLCAVAGLLDGAAAPAKLVTALNTLLAAL
jgi:hypothetical protein